jgi:benzoyl-CoA reductase/2-hydroxyglutaryl-CoA dehydratase subunit BcrC/BadD/HgdB
MWMRKEEHNRHLEELLAGLEETGAPAENGKVRLVLTGSLCTTPDFTEMVEGLGALVADDDLCCGHRYIEGMTPEDADPLAALGRRLSGRVICPAKHSPGWDRSEYLIEKTRAVEAKGVIFFLQNFCDPHAFDYPWLKERLQAEGVSVLLLESQLQTPALGQIQTRVEAFLEILRGA